MNRISVVIPAYNGEKYIEAAIQSAFDQILIADDGLPESFEVIVRDDGSTDGTLQALERMKALYPGRLRVIEGEHLGGIGKSFQAALEATDSEFVCIMGQDDQIDRDYLKRVMDKFAESPTASMVACHPRFINDEGKPYANEADGRLSIPKPKNRTKEEWLALFRHVNNYFGINTYKRHAVIDAGGFDPEAGWLLDWDLYTRLVKAGGDIAVIEEELCSLTLSSSTTSYITREKLPKQHQYLLHITEKNYVPEKMKVAFATPYYMSQGFSHHADSMIHTIIMLEKAGIDWELIRINGDSYVDRAKNTIAAEFLDSDCTDLIMIDSDEQWHPMAIARLLQHPEWIVAGAYPFKNNWGRFAGNPKIVEKEGVAQYANFRALPDGAHLLEAHNVAGGFLRIKRPAMVQFAKAFPEAIYTDAFAWPSKPERIYTAFFMCDIENYERYGEDAYFSRKMQEAGITLWIDPNISIIHYGVSGYEGNMHEHLMAEKIKRDAATAETNIVTLEQEKAA
jgi:glycosyltransferase involved in cell wall biosynthesis